MKRCSINSTPRIELSCTKATCRGHGVRSRTRVTGWGHVQRVYELPGVICIYKWAQFNGADSLRVKRKYQLVVKLKANKYYPKLLSFLSSYINLLNLLNLKACAVGFWPLTNSRSLALNPDLRPLAVPVLILAFGQLFLSKVCRNSILLRWVATFDPIVWSIVCIISSQSSNDLKRNLSPW